jgi:TatA/E family protein of Tat protein translocase
MFGIGPLELVVILVVALLVFGPKRVPELARSIGRGLAEFRRASNDLRESLSLDELQQDLRRDLTGNQTIHRPENRPAQAGDEVDSGEKPTAEEAPSEATSAQEHPGEIPMDNVHEHHNESADADTNENGETSSNSTADPELGNLPVSGSNPADPRRG